jgi:hypothetical protein
MTDIPTNGLNEMGLVMIHAVDSLSFEIVEQLREFHRPPRRIKLGENGDSSYLLKV